MIFWRVMQSVYSNQDDVGVSIDPIGPDTPSWNTNFDMKVSYYGGTTNTHLGWVMFEADRYLKTLSMGTDNITGQPVTSMVPGYRSELEWSLETRDEDAPQQWHRMWFMLEDNELVVKINAEGTTIMFDTVPIVVQARFVIFDAQGQKYDVPGSSQAVDAFVQHFNSHFQEFAAEKNEIGQLIQQAKLLSIARWLYKAGVPVDFGWLGIPDHFETPTTTPGQTVSESRKLQQGEQTITYEVSLLGGVDFSFENVPQIPPQQDLTHHIGELVTNISYRRSMM